MYMYLWYAFNSYQYNVVNRNCVHSCISISVSIFYVSILIVVYTVCILYMYRCVSVHSEADPDLQLQGAKGLVEVGHHRERHGKDQMGKIAMRVYV